VKASAATAIHSGGYELLSLEEVSRPLPQAIRPYEYCCTPEPVSESSSSSGDTAVNQIAYTYDGFGQLATEAQEHAGVVIGSTPVVTYTHADGSAGTARLTRITYPNGKQVDFDYGSSDSDADLLSRVAAIKDLSIPTTFVEYTWLGLATAALTNYPQPVIANSLLVGGTATNPYACLDRFGRLLRAVWGTAATTHYTYDRASNRSSVYYFPGSGSGSAPQLNAQVLSYDGAHRLTEAVRGSSLQGTATRYITNIQGREHWQLDATGNWREYGQLVPYTSGTYSGYATEQARTANAANEITGIRRRGGSEWSIPEYDRNGNAVSFPAATPTSVVERTATYDAWNRLINAGAGTYEYDGVNRRIQIGNRHFYYSSDWQVLEERNNASPNTAPAERQYVWGLRYIDDLVVRDRSPSNNGTLSERLYSLTDGNWNVMAIVNASAAVQERYLYSAYGLPILFSPTWTIRATSSFDWNILYAGYRFDVSTGLYQVRHRHLNPALGCWLIRDPIGYFADTPAYSLYAYSNANPVTAFDPLGLAVVSNTGITKWLPAGVNATAAQWFGGINSVTGTIHGATEDGCTFLSWRWEYTTERRGLWIPNMVTDQILFLTKVVNGKTIEGRQLVIEVQWLAPHKFELVRQVIPGTTLIQEVFKYHPPQAYMTTTRTRVTIWADGKTDKSSFVNKGNIKAEEVR
jgi:RHS repeat-associated protein